MEERFEINEDELDEVVGGSLIWSREGVYCKEDPGAVFSFTGNYAKCRLWIQENWKGKPQDNALLFELEAHGLIHRI